MSDRSASKASRLAQRFRAAIQQEAAAQRIAAEQERLERERLEGLRGQLLDDLAAFGAEVGSFRVERGEGVVTLRFQDRSLRFEAVGERGKVKVEGDGLDGENKLFMQDPLGRWVWSREDRYGREHREVLFDSGLEKLVSVVMEIAPLAEEEMSVSAAPSTGSTEAEVEGGAAAGVPFPPKTL
jgi:hypothetical protein